MEKRLIRQYFLIVTLLSVAIALTIRFPMVMSMLFGESQDHHDPGYGFGFSHFFYEFFVTFIVALLMFTMNYFILRPLEKHGKIKALSLFLAVILTLISVQILNHILFSLSNSFYHELPGRGHRSEFDFTNFFVSALVVGCVLIIRLIFQKQNITLENEQLKREALQSQYESLKNQLSPHFLFNSLTALKTLIDEDSSKAQNYVNSLSKALRYTLQSNEKRLVTLGEEMKFMDSYLYLIRMRYDANLVVKTDIDEGLMQSLLPPLTLQTLVENAIKHNEVSSRKPLLIEIMSTGNYKVVVRNNIQKKLTGEEGTGIGLTNLSKQFRLLIGHDIIIRSDDGCFIVELQLTSTFNESTDN
jgi:hypothetical protein